jgi:membrane protease YdiL (CAAX protease family)
MSAKDLARLAGVAALWLALGRLLSDHLWRILPDALLGVLSLPAYSMIGQLTTTLVGLAVMRLAVARPWDALALYKVSGWPVAFAALLAPAVFVFASIAALEIAEPFLIAELAREGAGASRRNAGDFGKAITQAPVLLTLVWGAVLAAIAEELAFRGALFAAVEHAALATFARGATSSPPSIRARRTAGIVAVLITAIVFGAMHADMKGSVGIVRVASATLLGLALGWARFATSSLWVPMAMHFVHNSVSLGLARGVFRGDSEPLLSVVPNRLLAIAAIAAFVAFAIAVSRRAARDAF